jgi:hypothetical protein
MMKECYAAGCWWEWTEVSLWSQAMHPHCWYVQLLWMESFCFYLLDNVNNFGLALPSLVLVWYECQRGGFHSPKMFYRLGSTVGWLYFTSYEPTPLLKVDLGWWWSYDSAQCSQGWLCCCSQEVILFVVPQWLIIIYHGRMHYWNPVWVSMWAPVVMLNGNLIGLARWRGPVDLLQSDVIKVKFWSNFEGRPETGEPLPSDANCRDSILAILPGWTRACVLFCYTWHIACHYSLSWWTSLVCLSLVDMKKCKYWCDAEFGSFSNQAVCYCASSWMKLVDGQQERWSDAGPSTKPTAVPSTCSG